MKGRMFRRILSATLSLCMVLTLLPASAFAANESTTADESTASETVNGMTVEYFTSTLYNWDEDKANEATAAVDAADTSSVSYSSTTVSYSNQGNYSTYTSGSYYYLYNGEYVQVTSLSASQGSGNNRDTITWTINGTYEETIQQSGGGGRPGESTGSGLTLYQQTTGGKGFYFTNGDTSSASSVPVFSQWLDSAQNYMIYSGLAAAKLSDSSNAPFNDDTVNAANLFASSDNDYTKVYSNVSVPFVYDEDTGYYTLDSDQWAVYFDGTASSGATLAIADKPAAHSYSNSTYNTSYATGFLPFNSLSSTTSTVTALTSGSAGTTTAYTTSGDTVWGFGMVTSVDFQMTDDGKDEDGNAITFEFSGDDDVWVYIDGVLVLDIGGTHDAITGTIDFSTGEVELTSCYSAGIGDLSGKTSVSDVTLASTLSQTNIYTALGTTLTGFASSGNHTLTIYYMERGRGRSNCLIKFNLPQKDSVSVTKEIESTYTGTDTEISDTLMTTLNNIDFTFTLYKDGVAVPNKSYSLYDSDGNLVGTGSTDSAGTFTIKAGQTATFKNISLDDETSYYVVETSPGERWSATWSATSNVSGYTTTASEDESGLTSATVTVDGSNTSTDTISFVCKNSYAPSQSDPDIDVNNDTIVLDYGLPVEVDVMANDLITVDGEDYKSDESVALTIEEAVDGTYTGTYGNAEVKTDKDGYQTIVYTMTKQLTGIETITYKVSATHVSENAATATLTIIPATLMYYEENFGDSSMVTYSNSNVKWTSIGTSATGYQETGFVGTTIDSTYGTDAVYLEETGDSYGTSMKADVSGNYGAAFEYDFTGTGTAILSRISTNSAYIQVKITNKSTNAVVDTQYIDTRVVKNVSDNTTLYNIPVYNIDSLDYGTYHVYVYVYKAKTTVDPTYDTDGTTVLASSESGGEFFLDGIRVYQPMGTEEDNVTGYSTAASAYATDGEANVSIINIRAKIAADENLNGEEFATLTDTYGNITDADTYTAIGPNEELYLTENQTVSFYLVNWASQSYKIYLGIKAPSDTAGTVTIGSTELTISNSTVCYYDISDYVVVQDIVTYDDDDNEKTISAGVVTITGGSELIALTNLKVTGVDAFDLGYSEDITVTSENTVSVTSLDEDTLYLLPTTVTLTADDSADEDEEETAVFTPETIKVVCNWASKTRKATVTVSTSTEVKRVTINGEDVTYKKVSGQYNWSKTYTKVTKGTEYEIVVYDADGNASETYTVTAK